MSKISNLQRIDCFKGYLEQLSKGKQYNKPRTNQQNQNAIKVNKNYKEGR